MVTGFAWYWGIIFFSPHFEDSLEQAFQNLNGATVFGYYVDNPCPFGVVEFDEQGNVLSLEEKPKHPKSNYIVPGLYFYDYQVCEIARKLKPSARGELEITDVNIEYMRREQLKVVLLDEEFTWYDAGTADSLLVAADGIRHQQKKNGNYIACVEETAWRKGFITTQQKNAVGEGMRMTPYGQYLLGL